MRIKKKNLNLLIDKYLLDESHASSDFSLLKEQQGTNTFANWREPSAGQKCQLNITSLLTKNAISQKAAENINQGLSFILSRFMGMNSWMCDIINIGLKVPREIKDTVSPEEQANSKEGVVRLWLGNVTSEQLGISIFKAVKAERNAGNKKAKLLTGTDNIKNLLLVVWTGKSRSSANDVQTFLKTVANQSNLFNNQISGVADAANKITDANASAAIDDFIMFISTGSAAEEFFNQQGIKDAGKQFAKALKSEVFN